MNPTTLSSTQLRSLASLKEQWDAIINPSWNNYVRRGGKHYSTNSTGRVMVSDDGITWSLKPKRKRGWTAARRRKFKRTMAARNNIRG